MGAFYSDYVCFAHHIHGDIYLYWFPKKNSTLSLLYKMDFKSFLEFQWNAICQVIAWNDKESWIKMNSFFVVYMMRVCLLGNLGLLFSHKKKRWSSHKPHLFFSFSAYLIPKAPTPSPEPIQPQLLARPRLRLTMNTACKADELSKWLSISDIWMALIKLHIKPRTNRPGLLLCINIMFF